MPNDLQLVVDTKLITTINVAEQVGRGTTVAKKVVIQNISGAITDVVTIGTKESLQAGVGLLLNPPPGTGQAGGAVSIEAPEDQPEAWLDLSQLFWVSDSATAKIAVMKMAYGVRPLTGAQERAVAYYPR